MTFDLGSSVSSVSVFGIQIRYLAHPFSASGLAEDKLDHAAGVATVFAFMSPLPDDAGLVFILCGTLSYVAV